MEATLRAGVALGVAQLGFCGTLLGFTAGYSGLKGQMATKALGFIHLQYQSSPGREVYPQSRRQGICLLPRAAAARPSWRGEGLISLFRGK